MKCKNMKVKTKQYGSHAFSKAETAQGYKVAYTANQLHAMDVDRLHYVEDYTMAKRRNGTSSGGNGAGRSAKKNLRTSESSY